MTILLLSSGLAESYPVVVVVRMGLSKAVHVEELMVWQMAVSVEYLLSLKQKCAILEQSNKTYNTEKGNMYFLWGGGMYVFMYIFYIFTLDSGS